MVLSLLYTYWDSYYFCGLFISNLFKILKFAATHRKMTTKSKYHLISKNVCWIKNIMRASILGNPRTTIVILTVCSECTTEMAGLNINRRQRSSDKEHTSLSSFFPFAVVLPALCSLLHRQWNKGNYSTLISEIFFTFLREKLFEKNFSRWMSAKRCCNRLVPSRFLCVLGVREDCGLGWGAQDLMGR